MLLKVQQVTGQPRAAKNYPVQDVNSAKLEKHGGEGGERSLGQSRKIFSPRNHSFVDRNMKAGH